MLVRIDTTGPDPIYAQIVREVRLAIARGDVRAGDKLPPARDLARSLDVNMHTVLRAYAELRDAGDIELRRGRGAIVQARDELDEEVETAIERLLAVGRKRDMTLDALHRALDERGRR